MKTIRKKLLVFATLTNVAADCVTASLKNFLRGQHGWHNPKQTFWKYRGNTHITVNLFNKEWRRSKEKI